MIIAGGGGYGCEVASVLDALGVEIIGVVDDGDPDLDRLGLAGLAFLGTVDPAPSDATVFVVGIGYPHPRLAVAGRLEALGLEPCNPIIHPSAALLGTPTIGVGSVVMPNATVSRGVRTGRHVLVNYNASVGHDTVLGDGVTVGPNAAIGGECTIGAGVLIGSGAVVLQGISIGDEAVVGSGAVVTSDVQANETVVGVPARVI